MDTVAKGFGLSMPKLAKSKLVGHRCSNPELVMGIELEIERVTHGMEWMLTNLPQNIWTIDRDGSLRPPETSYEFISKPLEMGFLLGELQSFFDKMKLKDESYSDRTSVHVHTNVQDFTQKQMATLALVYVVFEDVLFQFVNHYKRKTDDGYSRDTNIYCIPWNQCRMNYGLVNTIFANPAGAFNRWQKYTALNLLPVVAQGTVEWRHMHGTSDMEKLTIWLNLIGSIMKFAKTVDFDEVVNTIKVLNDTSAYQQFFTQVLQDRLPYDPNYQQALSEGVINAKYSLINWETYKGKKPAPAARSAEAEEIDRTLDDWDNPADDAAMIARIQRDVADRRLRLEREARLAAGRAVRPRAPRAAAPAQFAQAVREPDPAPPVAGGLIQPAPAQVGNRFVWNNVNIYDDLGTIDPFVPTQGNNNGGNR